MIDNQVIEEIKSRNDIVDVVSSYISLKRAGSNMQGLCPFHSEKTPSFVVFTATQGYYCFGCGAGGNVIRFIMNYENYTFQEAVKYLAERAGVTLPEVEFTEEARQKQSIQETAHTALYQLQVAYLHSQQILDDKGRLHGLPFLFIRR